MNLTITRSALRKTPTAGTLDPTPDVASSSTAPASADGSGRPVRPKRRLARTVAATTAAGALMFGFAASASASPEPEVNSCVDFVHTNHWYSRTQKVVGTNTCRTGTYQFELEIAYPTGLTYSTPCFSVGPGESAGWQWPRPGRDYRVHAC